jgi:hypothetical protein
MVNGWHASFEGCRRELGGRGTWLAGVWLLWAASGLLPAARPEERSLRASYDVTPRALGRIPAGTVIDDGPPQGWSHLVIKSRSVAKEGDASEVPKLARDLAGLLFTAIVADVRPIQRDGKPAGYRLARLAVGLGTEIAGRDTIITADTQEELGADFGFIKAAILEKSEERLKAMQLVARSNTMAVCDIPAIMLVENAHAEIVLRYALLVDARSGRLDTLVWALPAAKPGQDRTARDSLSTVEWLAPSMLEECVLHVDKREFVLGIPSERAFAIMHPPRGKHSLDFAELLPQRELREAACSRSFTLETAAALERALHRALRTSHIRP